MKAPQPRHEHREGIVKVSEVLSHPDRPQAAFRHIFASLGLDASWTVVVGDNRGGLINWRADRIVIPRARSLLNGRASRPPRRRAVAPRWQRT